MNNPKCKSRHEFMVELLKDSDFKVINGIGLLKLSNGNVVKCQLINRRTFEQYEGLSITITNMTKGKLDHTTFWFSDHLVHAKNNHPNSSTRDNLKIIKHCGWSWYINFPTKSSIKPMFDTIKDVYSFFE